MDQEIGERRKENGRLTKQSRKRNLKAIPAGPRTTDQKTKGPRGQVEASRLVQVGFHGKNDFGEDR